MALSRTFSPADLGLDSNSTFSTIPRCDLERFLSGPLLRCASPPPFFPFSSFLSLPLLQELGVNVPSLILPFICPKQ